MRKQIVMLVAATFIAGCTSTAEVPVASTGFVQFDAIPGKYAALVQSGGWAINVKMEGLNCLAWDFNTDVNPSYIGAMQEAFRKAIGNVDFISSPMTPQDLAKSGYDAQIIVMQGGARGAVVIRPGLLSATSVAEVNLDAILAVTDVGGTISQQPITATGTASSQVYLGCGEASAAVGVAAKNAVEVMVKDAVLYARDGLRKRRDPAGAGPAQTKPVS